MAFEWLKGVEHSVREHPYGDVYDIPECYEIEFPLPAKLEKILVEKFGIETSIVFGEPKGIGASMSSYFKNLADDQLRLSLLELVETFQPTSLVFTSQCWYVRAVSVPQMDRAISHLFFHLPSLSKIKNLEQEQQPIGCVGIREDYPSEGGFFPTVFEINNGFFHGEVRENRWRGSVPIFNSSNGEVVVCNRAAEVGWFKIERGEIASCNFTICDFLKAFIRHVLSDGWRLNSAGKKIRWPLDSYSFALRHLIQDIENK